LLKAIATSCGELAAELIEEAVDKIIATRVDMPKAKRCCSVAFDFDPTAKTPPILAEMSYGGKKHTSKKARTLKL
jgi:hypothetical protein